MWKSILLAGGLMAGLAFNASAQISAQRGPIQIEADRLDFLDKEGQAIYMGNVDAIQGDARIRAEKLTIYFAKKTENGEGATGLGGNVGDVERLVAQGEVYYMTPNEKAKGDEGVYALDTDTITLTGNVTLTRGENVIVGDKLVVNVAEGRSRMEANSTARGERVRTVIITGEEQSE
ncbi:MAG: lipopolysaccharide transport periplasmic protein LptA [Ponticaulis sp.]|nr:lipopolysaccharide transport periplasmic protein LptA [Ponticaulis sp.]